jgi:hypothetical protein
LRPNLVGEDIGADEFGDGHRDDVGYRARRRRTPQRTSRPAPGACAAPPVGTQERYPGARPRASGAKGSIKRADLSG